MPKEAQTVIGQPSMKRVIDWLNAPDGRFGDDPRAGRDALVARSLTEAVDELTKKLGPDMTAWRWGQETYHHALIHHPLAEIAPADVRARLNVGPYPRGGDSYTVSATGNADNQTSGGSLEDHRRHGKLGQRGRPEQSRTVGRSGEPALPRSVRDLVARRVLPDLLHPGEGGVGRRGAFAADARPDGDWAGAVGGKGANDGKGRKAGRKAGRQEGRREGTKAGRLEGVA